MINPNNDGIDHINVYSKGKTELGRFLSNFTYSVIDTEDGEFNSIEAYWYWLGCNHPEKDKLRKTFGFKAKQLGRELGCNDWIDSDQFKEKIRKAIKIKIEQKPYFYNTLKDCKLPLKHYYLYGTKVVEVPKAQWIIDYLETFKEES